MPLLYLTWLDTDDQYAPDLDRWLAGQLLPALVSIGFLAAHLYVDEDGSSQRRCCIYELDAIDVLNSPEHAQVLADQQSMRPLLEKTRDRSYSIYEQSVLPGNGTLSTDRVAGGGAPYMRVVRFASDAVPDSGKVLVGSGLSDCLRIHVGTRTIDHPHAPSTDPAHMVLAEFTRKPTANPWDASLGQVVRDQTLHNRASIFR